MRLPSVLSVSVLVASAAAFPAYVDVEARQTWQVRPWNAPGPNDGK